MKYSKNAHVGIATSADSEHHSFQLITLYCSHVGYVMRHFNLSAL